MTSKIDPKYDLNGTDIRLFKKEDFDLTEKQQKFADYYFDSGETDLKGALYEAGYARGNPAKTSKTVFNYLRWKRARLELNGELNINEMVVELKKIAFSNLDDVVEFDSNGFKLKDSHKVNPTKRRNFMASLSGISSSKSFGAESHSKAFSVKQTDKHKALETLIKLAGGFDKQESKKRDRSKSVSSALEAIRNLKKSKAKPSKDTD